MGAYINPKDCSKEDFLRDNAKEVTKEIVEFFDYDLQKDLMPVILVDNGPFTAAGIAFSARERDVFLMEDGRPKRYFLAEIKDLHLVSEELKDYIGAC